MKKAMEKGKHFLTKKNHIVFFRRLFLAAFVVGCIVLEFSFPSFAAPSWIRSGESEVYQNIQYEAPEIEEQEEAEEDSIMKHLSNLFSFTTNSAQELSNQNSQFGMSLNSIVLGRAAGFDISIAKFELYKNNPYGIIGAVGFVILRNVVYGSLVIYFLWGLVKNSVHSGVNNRRELKEDIYSALVIIGILFFVPVVINWITVARDSVVFRISENLIGTTGTSAGLIEFNDIMVALREQQRWSFIRGMIRLAYSCAGIFYMGNYVLVALQSTILFIFLPFAVLKGFKDKRYLEGWLMKLFANLIIPLIDYILLLTPIWIQKAYDWAGLSLLDFEERITMAVITVLIIWSVIPARNYIMGALGNSGAGARAGGFGMAALMAMRMLTGNKGFGGGTGSGGGQGTMSDLTNAERYEALGKDLEKGLSEMDGGKTWREFGKFPELEDGRQKDTEYRTQDIFGDENTAANDITASGNSTAEEITAADEYLSSISGTREYSQDVVGALEGEEHGITSELAYADGQLTTEDIEGISELDDNNVSALEIDDGSYQSVAHLDSSTVQTEEDAEYQNNYSDTMEMEDNAQQQSLENIPAEAGYDIDTREDFEGVQDSVGTQDELLINQSANADAGQMPNTAERSEYSELPEMEHDKLLKDEPLSYEDAKLNDVTDEVTGKTFGEMSQGQQLDYLREQNLRRMDNLKEWQDRNNVHMDNAQKKMFALSEEATTANRQKLQTNQKDLARNRDSIAELEANKESLQKKMETDYEGFSDASRITDSGLRSKFERDQAELSSMDAKIKSLHHDNHRIEHENAELEKKGTTYDADKYNEAKREYLGIKAKSDAVQAEISARQQREEVFTRKTEMYTGDGRTYESADALREVRVNRERLRKQVNFRNFDSSPAGNILSPDEKAHYARVRAATNVAGTAAKAVVGTLGAGAMMAGGASSMMGGAMAGAMVVDAVGNRVLGTAEYVKARNDNNGSKPKETEEEEMSGLTLRFTDTSEKVSEEPKEKQSSSPSKYAQEVVKQQRQKLQQAYGNEYGPSPEVAAMAKQLKGQSQKEFQEFLQKSQGVEDK